MTGTAPDGVCRMSRSRIQLLLLLIGRLCDRVAGHGLHTRLAGINLNDACCDGRRQELLVRERMDAYLCMCLSATVRTFCILT